MKKKIVFLFIIGLLFISGCEKSKKGDSVEKKNYESFEFILTDYGINSKILYDKNNYGKFEIKENESNDFLYFEDLKSNLSFRLNYVLTYPDFIKNQKKEFAKLKKYKEFKVGNYNGFIYSGENDYNLANVVLILSDKERDYYVANIEIMSIDYNEKDFVFDSISNDKEFLDLLEKIEFKYDTKKYNELIDSKNKNE